MSQVDLSELKTTVDKFEFIKLCIAIYVALNKTQEMQSGPYHLDDFINEAVQLFGDQAEKFLKAL